jgi:hypothetical protein
MLCPHTLIYTENDSHTSRAGHCGLAALIARSEIDVNILHQRWFSTGVLLLAVTIAGFMVKRGHNRRRCDKRKFPAERRS